MYEWKRELSIIYLCSPPVSRKRLLANAVCLKPGHVSGHRQQNGLSSEITDFNTVIYIHEENLIYYVNVENASILGKD